MAHSHPYGNVGNPGDGELTPRSSHGLPTPEDSIMNSGRRPFMGTTVMGKESYITHQDRLAAPPYNGRSGGSPHHHQGGGDSVIIISYNE